MFVPERSLRHCCARVEPGRSRLVFSVFGMMRGTPAICQYPGYMTRRNDIILEESLEWIRRNPNATNQDVPPDLREKWMIETTDEPENSGFQLTVFTFGYCQRQLVGKGEQKLEIAASRVLELFQIWQMKLGLAEVNERTELKSKPVALYDFPADEIIECWR